MIYHIFILAILYLVEAFVPPLDGVNDYIDVQNSLADKANVLENEFAEYYDEKIDKNYANYGDDYNLQYDNFYNDIRGKILNDSLVRPKLIFCRILTCGHYLLLFIRLDIRINLISSSSSDFI